MDPEKRKIGDCLAPTTIDHSQLQCNQHKRLSLFSLSLFPAIIVFVTHAGALKATSLIHAKKSANATTTTTEAGENADEQAVEDVE
jgi:hypothetical protein